ncbi:MAG TPA: acyltransferase family protein, partial [Mycobacteriales bacterium]|nr:acyltransferase family protein [Mycobacteriales bacterium]
LFFVLSGVLVTSVILTEVDETGRLRIGNFYSRRVRRLLPAALVTVVATCLVFLLVFSVVRRLSMVGDAQAALLYVANWHFLAQAGDYFATDIDKSPFLHFWSLSIEEQYYFIFPALVLVVCRLRRRSLATVLAALFVLSLAAQLYWARHDASHAYYGTEARFYQLMAGSFLAVAFRDGWLKIQPRGGNLLATVGLAGLLVLGSGLLDLSASTRGIGAMAVSTLLIAGLMFGDRSWIAQLLSRPIPVFLGRISYGTYLWHWPVILVLRELLTVGATATAALTAALATGLAALSYEVLEMPIRRSRYLSRIRWTPAVAGVGLSALVAVTAVPWVLESDRRPAIAEVAGKQQLVGKLDQTPVKDIDWSAVRKDVGDEGWCTADDVERCTVVHGSGPHVLFVGDSQAEMLVPMFKQLARDHDLTLSLDVVAGCPWQTDLLNLKQSPTGQRQCDEARVGWYEDVLPKLDPDVVILLDRPRDDPKLWSDLVRHRGNPTQSLAEATYQTTQETLAKITAVVPRTLIVQRIIVPETFDPSDCLAKAKRVGECTVTAPIDLSPTDGFYAAAAALSPKVDTVDLNPAFCPAAPLCSPVVDGQVVWRDDHHVAAVFAIHQREQVWRILRATGAFDTSG